MIVQEIHITEYDSFFNDSDPLFLKAYFYLANTPKDAIKKIKCFVGIYKSIHIGIIGLEENGTFLSPYRAPFGGFRSNESISYNKMKHFIIELEHILHKRNNHTFIYTLPPLIYNNTQLSTWHSVLTNFGYFVKNTELNQYFDLKKFNIDFTYLNEKDKKNTKLSLQKKLSSEITVDPQLQEKLYNLFKESREERNIPLKLSWLQLKHISNQIDSDYWIVKTIDGNICSGAVIFHLNEQIAQIIYWGFANQYAQLDSMRYLSYELFKYYSLKGKQIIDIGISTENSISNEGLIEFKENIGCESCLKFEYIKTL